MKADPAIVEALHEVTMRNEAIACVVSTLGDLKDAGASRSDLERFIKDRTHGAEITRAALLFEIERMFETTP